MRTSPHGTTSLIKGSASIRAGNQHLILMKNKHARFSFLCSQTNNLSKEINISLLLLSIIFNSGILSLLNPGITIKA